MLRRHPTFAAVAVLTLALGIGANTAVFTLLDAVLLRPLPYPAADRLVMIWDTDPEFTDQRIGPTPANMLDWRVRTRSFDGMAAWYAGDLVTLQAPGTPEKIARANVTMDFFTLIGRAPLLGRTFTPEEVAAQAPVAVIAYGLWQARFGGDPEVVGRRIVLDGDAHDVIGVMPADFALPNRAVGLWLPWEFTRSWTQLGVVPRDYRYLRVIARLSDEVPIAGAQADLETVAAELAVEYPDTNAGWTPRLIGLRDELAGSTGPALLVLFGAVCFVLLIACTNVANLLLARATDRRREMAVRRALGAGRARIARQVLTESVLLALAGGVLGVAAAEVGLAALTRLAPANLPQLDGLGVDPRVLGFSLALSVVTGLIFGVVPALDSAGAAGAGDLRHDRRAGAGRGHQRTRGVLVVLQIASALALLVGAGLLLRSFVRLLEVEPGFDADRLLVVRVFPDAARYSTTEQRLHYFDRLREQVGALPGVTAVGAATGLPLNAFNNTPLIPYWAAERPDRATTGAPEAEITMVTAGFFGAMRIPLLRGREFDSRDDADAPRVVIVNQALANQVWADGDPVGRRLMLDYSRPGVYPYEVVGVVGSTRALGLKISPPPAIYMPHAQVAYVTMHLVARTSGPPLALADAVRREVLALDPAQPAHSVTTMAALVGAARATDRFAMVLLGVLAMLAVGLALSGVYSLLAHTVSQRRREFGIRMALGARLEDIVGLVMRQEAMLVTLGLAIGLLAAFGLSRTLTALLYDVSSADLPTYVVSPLAIGLVALAAVYLPAAAPREPLRWKPCGASDPATVLARTARLERRRRPASGSPPSGRGSWDCSRPRAGRSSGGLSVPRRSGPGPGPGLLDSAGC